MPRRYRNYLFLAPLLVIAVAYQAGVSQFVVRRLLQHPEWSTGEWVLAIGANVVAPAFCLALGFWVAALRPWDRLAWLLLALLISFSHLQFTDLYGWNGDNYRAVILYHSLAVQLWPLWMMLFGIYFPEPVTFERRRPWLKWLLIVPFLSEVLLSVTAGAGITVMAPLAAWIDRFPTVQMIFRMLLISVFFACMGKKAGTASTPDAKRRLMLLYVGASISMTPMFLLVVRGLLAGDTDHLLAGVPGWIVFPALLLLALFPVTLAYVIVVQRAMEVRVVMRQGIRYAFARGGAGLLRVAVGAVIFLAATSFVERRRPGWTLNAAVIIVALLFLIMRRAREQLRLWIDRRFFREAYNAEQILSDLSEQVRTMVETAPVLETVSRCISDSLHVPRVATLTKTNGSYRPAHALGFGITPEVTIDERAGAIEELRHARCAVHVYLGDPNSWIHGVADGERQTFRALDTQLLLPLGVKDRLLGFISLGPKLSEEPYSGTDVRLLETVAAQTGLALENSRLVEAVAAEAKHRERLNRELEIAREVQERLFPQTLPAAPGLDYFGACRPAAGVGGDYYDFLALSDGKLGVAIGDVSGKGISAALLMASLQASLRGQTMGGPRQLDLLMRNVNRLVYEASASNRYATFFYGQYEPHTRRLDYVNAGHNAPMILRAGCAEVLRLAASGPVVGLLPRAQYEQASVTLEPGDLVVFFTDGISEAMNLKEEEWEEERLIEAARGCEGLCAMETVRRLMSAADAFAAGAKQYDDMTLVVMRVGQIPDLPAQAGMPVPPDKMNN